MRALGLPRLAFLALTLPLVGSAVGVGCGASEDLALEDEDDDDNGSDGTTANNGGGPGDTTGFTGNDDLPGSTCEGTGNSYIGCEFWPTVTANNVWSIFDFAVVVANASPNPVEATVERDGSVVTTATIPAESLETIYLPWVPALKGDDADECGAATPINASVKLSGGAYHLTTNAPVTVYQFSALQYAATGGPPGKSWAGCPGDLPCRFGPPVGCFSYSNDASRLLPTTALTGNNRVAGWEGWSGTNPQSPLDMGGSLTITGTEDDTDVRVTLSATAQLRAGGGLAAASGNSTVNFTLQAGEVAELVGTGQSDFSGSVVAADKPVQVITSMPCVNIPSTQPACDHIEETVFPAETLGQRYFVTRPAHPNRGTAPHHVRIYGNVDGTSLSYPGERPPGAPTSIDAGQVVDLANVNVDFEVVGDNAFSVGTFMLGASIVDPGTGEKGDPSQSFATAVEQYRTDYIFLAPTDYDENYVQITGPADAVLTLDGQPVTVAGTPVASAFSTWRVLLGSGNNGAHRLTSDQPVGIQVAGYGQFTTYLYPGGSDLLQIAPPPD
ncbi:MAG: IgGFc-binding protein [Myxococcota bacterium]